MPYMKKINRILSFMLLLSMVFALAACAKEKEKGKDTVGETLDFSSGSDSGEESQSNTEDVSEEMTDGSTTEPTIGASEALSDEPTTGASEALSDEPTTEASEALSDEPTTDASEAPSATEEVADIVYGTVELTGTENKTYNGDALKSGSLYDNANQNMTCGELVKLYPLCSVLDGDKRVFGLVSAEDDFSAEAAAKLNLLCEAAYRATDMSPSLRIVDHMAESEVGYADYATYRAVRISYVKDNLTYKFSDEVTKPLADFMKENAADYGFVDLSSEGDDGHFRYVGIPHAAIMVDKGFKTLAEYHTYLAENAADNAIKVTLTGEVDYYIQSFAVSGTTATVKIPTGNISEAEVSATGEGHMILTITVYDDEDRLFALPYVAPSTADRTGTVICLDAGHGDHDPGAINTVGGVTYYEKDFNLAVTMYAKDYLEAMGYTVILTRDDDTFVELADRVTYALEHQTDLFISFHCNSTENPSSPTAIGPQIYHNEIVDPNKPNYPQYLNKTIANTFRNAINTGTAEMIASGAAQTLDEGDIRAGSHLAVLKQPRLPAVLLEMAFISNESDLLLLQNEDWQEAMGYSVAIAVENLFANDQLGVQ